MNTHDKVFDTPVCRSTSVRRHNVFRFKWEENDYRRTRRGEMLIAPT